MSRLLSAFAVAWGNLSTETARLISLLVLLLTLRHLGMKRFELIISLAWLMVGLAFVFIEAALATGVARSIQGLSTSPCLRRHFLPASVVSSTMYFILELFVIIRLWSQLPHDQFYPQRKWARLWDIRMLRAMSLVLLNLLTAVPSAIVTSTLVQSIPYSIGALGVLHDWELTNRQDSPDLSPSSARSSGSSISGREDAHFSDPRYPAWVPHHPYSARSLSNPAILKTWDDQRPVARTTTLATARSTRTIDSRTARSIRDAVIQQARREKLPGADDGYESPRLQNDAVAIESNAAVNSPRHVKPVRPKLVIVTRTNDSWPVHPATQTELDRSPPIDLLNSVLSGTPEDEMPSSRFSSPSLTTSESRSTITYPSRVLSFSSVLNPNSLEVPTPSISQSSSRSLESQDFRPEATITTNPELLGPPPAAPSGPRTLGA
ncbi:hypothetical protein GYMLUDRAFT_238273 [Collybiopsis luxurians FD-317 M1]|nr:hypothetical protein GYMLUDRAFT_238273 [Collybiopsis luxurians FD-317 M1]